MPNAMSDRPALRWPIQLFRYCDVIPNDDLMEFIRWHCLLVHFKSKHMSVGNQQKWDTFVKERSGGNGSVVGFPEQVVVAFAAG